MKTTITILAIPMYVLWPLHWVCIGLKHGDDEFFYEYDGHYGHRPTVESSFPEDVAGVGSMTVWPDEAFHIAYSRHNTRMNEHTIFNRRFQPLAIGLFFNFYSTQGRLFL